MPIQAARLASSRGLRPPRGVVLSGGWPYHAKVIKIFENTRSTTVGKSDMRKVVSLLPVRGSVNDERLSDFELAILYGKNVCVNHRLKLKTASFSQK